MSRRTHTALRLAGVAGLALTLSVPAYGQKWRSVESTRQRADERRLNVEVEYGAGRLTLAPAPRGFLYQMQVRYDEQQFRPVVDFDRASGTLRLGTAGLDRDRGSSLRRRSYGEAHATIRLNPEVPTRLRLEFGAGEADIDLGGMALEELRLATGASDSHVRFGAPNRVAAERVEIEAGAAELEVVGLGNTRAEQIRFSGGVGSTTLDFSGEWSRDARVKVDMGMGSVRLRLPESLGVRIQKDGFLTSFDADGVTRRDGSYFSRNWENAAHRVTIDIDAALGSIDVEWIR